MSFYDDITKLNIWMDKIGSNMNHSTIENKILKKIPKEMENW
jgi:hypothetical protein